MGRRRKVVTNNVQNVQDTQVQENNNQTIINEETVTAPPVVFKSINNDVAVIDVFTKNTVMLYEGYKVEYIKDIKSDSCIVKNAKGTYLVPKKNLR